MEVDIAQILLQYWGYGSFRPMQQEVIERVLAGKNTLAIMPTGGGKSLCYQLPALAMPGLCLVVSPLIALMKDQVGALRKKNITAYAIYAGLSWKEIRNILILATESNCKFLYVSPERLQSQLFLEYLPGLPINILAVDEAHCISQWGHDFRPAYRNIAQIRTEFSGVPIIALTASATPDVQEDICISLSGEQKEDWKISRQSFSRPMLSYSVRKVDTIFVKLLEILKKISGSSIVYCRTRKQTVQIASLLGLHNISASAYHAGMAQEDRNTTQENWLQNRTQVIVCTNAFGMGIDKPDVRLVIHAGPPDSMENYYQEAGRAGRDGKKAYAVLLYNEKNREELDALPAIRYPKPEDVKLVYKSLVHYLQIPVYTLPGEYYPFDLLDFSRRFKIPSTLTVFALKALEQDGWITYNDQLFLLPQVQFICTKSELQALEKSDPILDKLVKALLRTYEGLFDYPASISYKLLSGKLGIAEHDLEKHLFLLAQQNIIFFIHAIESPQISLMRQRPYIESFSIQVKEHSKRRDHFTKKKDLFVHYFTNISQCRAQLIGTYFGDSKLTPCGICDNCLQKNERKIDSETFRILQDIFDTLPPQTSISFAELQVRLPRWKKEFLLEALHFLAKENKIRILDNGDMLPI